MAYTWINSSKLSSSLPFLQLNKRDEEESNLEYNLHSRVWKNNWDKLEDYFEFNWMLRIKLLNNSSNLLNKVLRDVFIVEE